METRTRTRISDSEINEYMTGDESRRYDEIETAICGSDYLPRRDIEAGEWDVVTEDDDGLIWVWTRDECAGEWTRSDEPVGL